MISGPLYTIASTANGRWRISGPDIWGAFITEAFIYEEERIAQSAADLLNGVHAQGYRRAQYDIRKALGVQG